MFAPLTWYLPGSCIVPKQLHLHLKGIALTPPSPPVGELALTNFDTQRLEEIVSRGIRFSSNQVQYSLIDRRPAAKMEKFCLDHGVQMLTYGTLGIATATTGHFTENTRGDMGFLSYMRLGK